MTVAAEAIERILGKAALDALRKPITQACGLPGAAYTSEEFFKLEQKNLFAPAGRFPSSGPLRNPAASRI